MFIFYRVTHIIFCDISYIDIFNIFFQIFTIDTVL